MQRSIAEQVEADSHRRLVERSVFMEEQNIRKALGPALWEKLCGAIVNECKHANSVGEQVFEVDEQPRTLVVKRLTTAKKVRLEYEELSASISVYESGRQSSNITFRVDSNPAPSLMPMYNNAPMLLNDLAISLIQGTGSDR